MARQVLTQEQEEQIRGMKKDGKSATEIITFFKTTYSIDIPIWKITYIVNKNQHSRINKKTRKYIRKIIAFNTEVSIDQAVKDITEGLQHIAKGYTAIFLHLRLAVIKEKGKVYAMAKNAGIELKGDE